MLIQILRHESTKLETRLIGDDYNVERFRRNPREFR